MSVSGQTHSYIFENPDVICIMIECIEYEKYTVRN